MKGTKNCLLHVHKISQAKTAQTKNAESIAANSNAIQFEYFFKEWRKKNRFGKNNRFERTQKCP